MPRDSSDTLITYRARIKWERPLRVVHWTAFEKTQMWVCSFCICVALAFSALLHSKWNWRCVSFDAIESFEALDGPISAKTRPDWIIKRFKILVLREMNRSPYFDWSIKKLEVFIISNKCTSSAFFTNGSDWLIWN